MSCQPINNTVDHQNVGEHQGGVCGRICDDVLFMYVAVWQWQGNVSVMSRNSQIVWNRCGCVAAPPAVSYQRSIKVMSARWIFYFFLKYTNKHNIKYVKKRFILVKNINVSILLSESKIILLFQQKIPIFTFTSTL